MKRLIIILIILFAAPCFSGAYNPSSIWPMHKKALIVCFQSSSVTSIEATSIIREVLFQYYGHDKTFLNISGLKNCDETSERDVSIKFNLGGDSHADTYADIKNGSKKKGELIIDIALRGRTEGFTKAEVSRIKVTALHEFGHLLGLVHEHEFFVDDIQNDPNCLAKPDGRMSIAEFIDYLAKVVAPRSGMTYNEKFIKGYKGHGGYDNESIMNYCYIDKRDDSPPLAKISQMDLATLRFIYKGFDEQPEH